MPVSWASACCCPYSPVRASAFPLAARVVGLFPGASVPWCQVGCLAAPFHAARCMWHCMPLRRPAHAAASALAAACVFGGSAPPFPGHGAGGSLPAQWCKVSQFLHAKGWRAVILLGDRWPGRSGWALTGPRWGSWGWWTLLRTFPGRQWGTGAWPPGWPSSPMGR